jgi:hypothetical protein
VAEIGKAGTGNQPHIARANHGNSHETTRLSMVNDDLILRAVLDDFRRRGNGKLRLKSGISLA